VASTRFARVKEIVLAVTSLGAAERAAYMATACKNDPDLRQEVESLLAHDRADFVAAAKEAFDFDDVILVLCATGGRAAMAVNQLAQAGFTHVYNIINGFEGDRVDDPGSVFNGKHMRNGWKNAGLPWGYDFHPDLMWGAPDHRA
jgi:rhodanese-related sulfurtransferase